MTTRRKFIQTAGVAGAATLAAPAVHAQSKIKWRMQTYAGPALAEHVIKPPSTVSTRSPTTRWRSSCSSPTSSCRRASCSRPCSGHHRCGAVGRRLDAVAHRGDRVRRLLPVRLALLAGRAGAVQPVRPEGNLGRRVQRKVGVKHISAGAWDPCHFATKDPINSLADLKGKRVFTFPTAGKFLEQFGVVPVTLPWEDIEVAVQTGELDGIAWSGITEDYTVGWADVTDYFLTNNISGAWCGSFFANRSAGTILPDHLKQLLMVCMEQSHYYRQWWYWGGEASCASMAQDEADHRSRCRVGAGRRCRQGVLDEIAAEGPRPRRRWWTSSRSTTRTCRRPGGHTATADPAATVAGAHPGVPRFAVTVAI
jgi:hypothetical protein